MKNKNFLKKLAAVTLGFVMTLGVGAAGYAGAAGETKAADVVTHTGEEKNFTTSTKPTGWNTNGTFNSSYYKMTRGQYVEAEASSALFRTGYILSSDMTINVACGTFGTWSGAKTITFTYQFLDDKGSALSTQTYTTNGLNSTQGTYRGDATLSMPSDPSKIAKLRITFTTLTSGSEARFAKVKLTYTETENTPPPTAETYTIHFASGGGNGSMEDATVDRTKAYTIRSCEFTRAGYNFVDWLGSNNVHYEDGETIPANTFAANYQLTLTAQWKQEDPNFSITHTNFTEITASYTTTFTHNYTWNSKTIPVEAYGVFKNSNGIQMNKGKSTYIKNTQALGVKITKIECTWTASGANSPTLYVSENAVASTSSTSLGKGSSSVTTQTYNVTDSTKNYQYFYFDGATVTGACYLSELKIYYAPMVVHTITISGSSEVYVDKTITLTASCDQGDTITEWTSSDTNKATVSNGVVTGKAAGSVTITAKGSCNATGTKTITVKADAKTLESIAVGGSKKTTFYPGEKFAFGGTVTGTYSHSNGDPNSTETISSGYTFKIDGTSATVGSTTMTEGTHTVVVSYGGKDATGYQITVAYDDPVSITVTSETTMGPGDELELTPSVNPSTANQAVDYDYDVTEGDLIDETDFIFMDGSLVIDKDNVNFGTITITVSSRVDSNVYATCVVTVLGVKAPEIVGIDYNITGSYKAEQYVNKQPVDLTGFAFYAIYDNEETSTILASEIEWDDKLEVDDNPYGIYVDPVTGNYFDITIEEITIIADILVSISINTPAALTKSSYVVGEQWSSAGLSVSGLMDSGDTAASSLLSDVTYTFSPSEPSVGLTSVNVTAHVGTLNSTPVPVTVSVAAQTLTSISLDTQPTKKSYILGEQLDLSGMVLTAHYNLSELNHPMTASEYDVSTPDMFTISASTKVTISSKINPNFKVDFYISVRAADTSSGYQLVTSTSDLVVGTNYIFVSNNVGETEYSIAMGNKQAANNRPGVAITKSGNAITWDTSTVTPQIFELCSGSTTGTYAFKANTYLDKDNNVVSTPGYLAACNNSSNYMHTNSSIDGDSSFAIEISDNGLTTTIISQTSSYSKRAHMRFNQNNGSPLFSLYENETKATSNVLLYKECQGEEKKLIRISAVCNKTGIIPVGTVLEKSDFTVTGYYNDNTSAQLASTDFSATGLTLSNVGNNTVTISATGVASVDVVVQAVQATKYSLVLMNNSTQYGSTIEAIEGETVDLPTLEEAGKTFNGWTDGSKTYTSTYTMPANNVTLNASWTVNHYSVTYNANGGTGTAPTDSNSYVYDDEVTVLGSNGLTKDYCTFGGWSDGTSTYDEDDTFKITSDVSLSAIWTNNKVTVEYDKNGGGGNKPTTDNNINQGSSYTVKGATPTMIEDENRPFGTHFAGWNTAADGSGTSYAAGATINPIMENLKLYAQWKVDDVPAGGEGTIDFPTEYSDVTGSSSKEVPTDKVFNAGTIASVVFGTAGSNPTKYYANGSALRIYDGAVFTVSSELLISEIDIEFSAYVGISADVGSITGTTSTVWKGSSDTVKFTISGTNRIKSITVKIAGREIPEDATIVENLPGVGAPNPITLDDGTVVTGLIHERGVLYEGETVSFTASHGKVITYASVYMLYDMGYDLEYSNDYGTTWTYNPFAKVTRATRAGETEIQDLKDTNAVRFTLNDPDSEAEKDILKSFKVITSFGTNSNMSVDYDWEKAGNNYTIDITKACVRFSIDVDDSFEEYIGNDRYQVGFAISRNGHVIDSTGSIDSNASIQYYSKDYMPANYEFGLKVNTKLQLNETYYVVLFVYDTVSEEYIEISKEKAASFKDVFDAYFTKEVVDGLNAQEKAVYDELYSRLYPSAQ